MSAEQHLQERERRSQTFEVDVLIQRPITWRVTATTETEACQKAKDGDGEEITGVDYTCGEIVGVRRV